MEFIKCERTERDEARVYRCPLCCCMEFHSKEDFHRHLTSIVDCINQLRCTECQQDFPSLQEYTEHFLVDCREVEETPADISSALLAEQEQADSIQYVVVEEITTKPTELNQVEMPELPVEKRRARKSNLVHRKFIETSDDVEPQKKSSSIEPRQPLSRAQTAKKGKMKQKQKAENEDVSVPDDEFASYFESTEPATAPRGRQSKMPSSFCCEYCGKILKRNDDYIKHVRVHTGEKPCVCVVCGKRFRVTCGLTVHMRTHTNERPYHCSICPYKFKSFSQLTFHLQTHSEERNYQCPYCEKRFKTLATLSSHKKFHFKALECDLCHRVFSTKSLLKKHHRLVHSGQEFKCSLCGFAFGKAWVLENHLKTHHSETGSQNSESETGIVDPSLECFMDVTDLEPEDENHARKQKLILDI